MTTTPVTLHRLLNRQVTKHLTEDSISMPQVQALLAAVSASYESFERDQHLHEQSVQLNDAEHLRMNQALREELNKKAQLEQMLLQSIQKLQDNATSPTEAEAFDGGTRTQNRSIVELVSLLDAQIDQIKDMERELGQAKQETESASHAKTQFLSMMSHEIRTPLNSVIGLTHIMEQEDTLESYRENIGTLRICAQNLNLLINDILDFNKIDSGKLILEQVAFDVMQVITDIGRALEVNARERGNDLLVNIAPNVPNYLVGDPLRLGQILTNLVSNACKFTHHGRVAISCECIAQENEIATLRFIVKDTGIGIAKDKQALIFEEFTQADSHTTRRYGGTGLGLVITTRLLKLWHSKIDLVSDLGKGSSFAFDLMLPIAKESRTGVASKAVHHFANLNGLRILLVEDYSLNIVVAKKLLEMWGGKVWVAENGQIAVDMCEVHSFDAILMDIQMPVMDGYTAARLIHAKHPKIPILALTASASLENQDLAFESGMCDYVTKPINPMDLNAKLIQHCQSTSSAAQSQSNTRQAQLDLTKASAHFQNDDLVHQIIDMMRESMPQDIKSIKTAIAAADWVSVAKVLHQLKGYLPLIIDDQTGQMLTNVEQALKALDKPISALPAILEIDVKKLLEELVNIERQLQQHI